MNKGAGRASGSGYLGVGDGKGGGGRSCSQAPVLACVHFTYSSAEHFILVYLYNPPPPSTSQ